MSSSDPKLTRLPPLEELFDTPSPDDWRAAAEASLGGRPLESLTVDTHEGLAIGPLATAADGFPDPGHPGLPPFVRGRTPLGAGPAGWQVCQRVAHPDPATAASQAAEDVARGCRALWIVLDRRARTSDAEIEPGVGVALNRDHDLDPFFEAIDPAAVPIYLSPGGAAPAAAAALVAAARRRGVDPRRLAGSFGFDPVGALAEDGVLPIGLEGSLELLAELAHWTDWHTPGVRPITISTLVYHMAGADAVRELAYALATGVEYLRALTNGGFDPGPACRQIAFRHAIGRDLFMEAAKLRAARRLWARVAGACGAAESDRAAPIHAVASPRGMTTRDPWVNMLRTTVGAFAAAVGGADAVTVLPFDGALGPPDELGRRMAVNSQTILREESHLARVTDPGGGSWYLERLTDRLATAAWQRFQAIEAGGGMIAALLDGAVAADLAGAQKARDEAVAYGRDPITGVTTFPNLSEPVLQRDAPPRPSPAAPPGSDLTEVLGRLFNAANTPTGDGTVIDIAVDAAAAGATIEQLTAALRATRERTRTTRLPARREAEIFERLRDASDAWLDDRGVRPRIFLATMGPVAEHKPRAGFATNFFEAGGIETVTAGGFATVAEAADAFAGSGTEMAVICSSDARYREVVPELARELDRRGARTVLVGGRPGDHEREWRDAGVTGFVHAGCDQVRMLVDLLKEEGVLHV